MPNNKKINKAPMPIIFLSSSFLKPREKLLGDRQGTSERKFRGGKR